MTTTLPARRRTASATTSATITGTLTGITRAGGKQILTIDGTRILCGLGVDTITRSRIGATVTASVSPLRSTLAEYAAHTVTF